MRERLYFILIIFLSVGFIACKTNSNNPPEILNIIPAIEKTEIGKKIRFTCNVVDEEAGALTYSWQSNCGQIEFESSNNYADWQAPNEEGECTITLTVSDGESSDEYSFSILVQEPEKPVPPMVGVYYYPWYGGNDFHGRKYLREHLVPVQTPVLGEYKDTDSEVIKQHFEWCEYAGITLWVSSWWGPGKMTDKTLKNNILTHPDIGDLKIALFYETSNRVPDFKDTKNIASDIKYMADTYFDHPNYFKIEGKPVLFVYLTRVLSRNGVLDETVDLMRETAQAEGFEIYIVGDQVFGNSPSSTQHLDLLDAVTNYDVYGSSGGKIYATQEKVDNYYAQQAGWRAKAHEVGTGFIPATAPGYNDTGVRDGHLPLSRKLSENDDFGSLFEAMVSEAVTLVDDETGKLFMITSWNEWHEDTQIEPVTVAPPTSIDDSGAEQKYTAGLEYEGYGLRYLDIIREALGK